MLAWVHASLASEQELLVSLFGDDSQQAALERQGSAAGAAGGAAAAAAAQQAEGTAAAGSPDGAPTIPQLLDSVFESICRPLRVRGFRAAQMPTVCWRALQTSAAAAGLLPDAVRPALACVPSQQVQI